MISRFELMGSTRLRLTQRLALYARLEKFRFAASMVKSESAHRRWAAQKSSAAHMSLYCLEFRWTTE